MNLSPEATTNLGKLMAHLLIPDYQLTVSHEPNVFGGGIIKFRLVLMMYGKAHVISQMCSVHELELASDITVVGDAMLAKLAGERRKELGK